MKNNYNIFLWLLIIHLFFIVPQNISAHFSDSLAPIANTKIPESKLLNNPIFLKILNRAHSRFEVYYTMLAKVVFLSEDPTVRQKFRLDEIDDLNDIEKIDMTEKILKAKGKGYGNIWGPLEVFLSNNTVGSNDFHQGVSPIGYFNGRDNQDYFCDRFRFVYLLLHCCEIYSRIKPDLLEREFQPVPRAAHEKSHTPDHSGTVLSSNIPLAPETMIRIAPFQRQLSWCESFQLMLVSASSGLARQAILGRLHVWSGHDNIPELIEVSLAGEESPVEAIRNAAIDLKGRSGIMLVGLDSYLASGEATGELQKLNFFRDELPMILQGPLIVVASPESIATMFGTMPDFMSVRSFSIEINVAQMDETSA